MKIKNKNQKSKGNKAKVCAMFGEEWKSERFREYICWHIGGRNPIGTESTVNNMSTDKVVADVDMFRTRCNGRVVR